MLPTYQIARLAIQGLAQSLQHGAGNARERAPLRHSVNGRMLHIEHTRQFKRRHAPIVQHLAEPPFNRHARNVAATEHTSKLTLASCIRNGYISTMTKMDPDEKLAAPASSRTLTVRQWRELRAAFNGRCAYCNIAGAKIVVEHVIPKSRGGDDSAENILPACLSCISSKCDLTLTEWALVQMWWFERLGPGNSVKHMRLREITHPHIKTAWWRYDDDGVRGSCEPAGCN